MLSIEPFSLEALKKVRPYIQQNTSHCSDHSLGAIFMWHAADANFFVFNETFSMHHTVGGQKAFSWPVGKDVDGMIDVLLAYCQENKFPLRFYSVSEETLKIMQTDKRLSLAMGDFDERWSDYIYSFSETKTFQGRKYSGQRNHINKFKRLYGEPDIRFLEPEDKPKLTEMLKNYEKEHPARNYIEKKELAQTKKLIDAHKELGLFAACMEIDEEIVACSVGEVIGDMLIIHVEKALTKYHGAYPTMYQGFVRLMAEHLGKDLQIINREDDAGDPGLRMSKQQYQPIGRIHKFLVHVGSPMAKIKEFPVILTDEIAITAFHEDDKKAYLAMNLDVENNRFWGYDYREDFSITGEIDENTFFDVAMRDMRVGDSVNFAIRNRENDEMIGEGILWNFAADGSAELGCRLMPAYHGKGYGKTAFGAIADFAEKMLNLKVWARCFHENEASRRMIEANGFEKVREDETYFYFER